MHKEGWRLGGGTSCIERVWTGWGHFMHREGVDWVLYMMHSKCWGLGECTSCIVRGGDWVKALHT